MADGDVYKIIELVGTSKTSWEDAVKTVIDRATKTIRDLRIAEVKELDVRLENGRIAEKYKGVIIIQWQGGKPVAIYPPHLAEAQPNLKF